MKKLSTKKYWWLKRQAIVISLRNKPQKKLRLSKKNPFKGETSHQNWFDTHLNKGINLEMLPNKKRNCAITLPKNMNFSKNFEETTAQLLAIRKLVDERKYQLRYRLVEVNFNHVEKLSTSASLVLAAEIDRWNQVIDRKLKPESDKWNVDVRNQLSELGFFELLNCKSYGVIEGKRLDGLRIIKYIKGEFGDTKKAKNLRVQSEEMVGIGIKKTSLFQGLSEAITNVTHHAYPNQKTKKNWYMTASYNPVTTKLRIVFYDQGIGIPSSLPNSSVWGAVTQFLADKGLINDHPSRIKAAMEFGRTSTGESYRGKGLKDLLQFIDVYDNGYLSILSQRGLYRYMREDGRSSTKSVAFKTAIPGTLIIWTVKLH